MTTDIYRSATIKLTMWYLCIVMAISIVFSAVVYRSAANELATSLYTQSARIYQTFPVFTGNPFFRRDSDLVEGEHRILFSLAEFNIIVFVAAGFASYWLAKRTLQPIEEANERQKRFVADASHELRTPLTALKMNTEVALADEKASKQELQEALTSNLEEANKLNILLNTLLRLSQLETNDIKQSFVTISLKQLIGSALQQIAIRAEQKHIAITNNTKDASIVGNEDSLVQLMVILLDNAIKYSPDKSHVTISTSRHRDNVNIALTDQGIGIEPAALKHIFDRFYRADKARARNGDEGFGLGLSIAKHIADLHDGTITITSAVGKGTKATLSLPAISAQAESITKE